MGVWIQNKITGEWNEWGWKCVDTGEDPLKSGYTIFNVWLNKSKTKQKIMATDHNGKDHEIKFVKLFKTNQPMTHQTFEDAAKVKYPFPQLKKQTP